MRTRRHRAIQKAREELFWSEIDRILDEWALDLEVALRSFRQDRDKQSKQGGES